MALSAATVFQVQSTATAGNLNSGGFNPTNANMMSDLTTDTNTGNTNSPVVSSASYNFAAGDVNHWVYIQSGTNWTPGWYQIASVAANKATLSAAVGQAIQVTNNRFGTNTVAGVATVGTPTAGVFTIDYSQTDGAAFADTDLASTTGTTNPSTVTSAGHPFGKNMVGNLIHVTAGTNWTAGWYEIVSVSGTTATLDRAVGTSATLSSGTAKVGGAISLGATGTGIGDNAFFGAAGANQIVSGGRYFIKGNSTFTIGEAVTTTSGIVIEGYNTNRGDYPTGSGRPTISCAANSFTLGSAACIEYSIFTGTAATVVIGDDATSKAIYSKFINTSTTASRVAISRMKNLFACEAISYRGLAVSGSTAISGIVDSCYIHDSDIGFQTSSFPQIFINNIVVGCVTNAVNPSAGSSHYLRNNTLYGAENILGVGVNIASGVRSNNLYNNIIYGFSTGVSSVTTSVSGLDNYNDYYNNTADVSASTQWQKGANDIALNPQFANVAQITGSTATTTAGNHLVQSGATFITSGVVAGRDFVYVKSGTGVTAGIYGITSVDSETQITTDIAITANATADKVWQITTGRNFAIGTNLKAGAYPGVFPGGLTTGYLDIGAVQRQESSSVSGGSFTFG